MSIQIIDNFNISVSKPIDDRFVVGPQSFYTDKNDIPYKYIGLRVWDLNDGVPYVWDGSTWTSENSVSVSGSGSASYVPKFLGSGNSTVLGNSCIYVSGPNVGINNTSITTGYNLDVIGGVISQGATGFSGVGTLLTNLNASNITTGTMSLARLSNYTSSGWILTSGTSQPLYTNPYSITDKAASASTVSNETTNSAIHYVSFVDGFSTADYRIKVNGVNASENAATKQLTYKPSTGQLTSTLMATRTLSAKYINSVTSIDFDTYGGITYSQSPTALVLTTNNGANRVFVEAAHVNFGLRSTGTPRISISATPTAAAPSYHWYDDPNTGMYRPSADTIGFSTNGVERMRISNTGLISAISGLSASSVSIGGGNYITKQIVGRVEININGTGINIRAGSGYTASYPLGGSGPDLEIIVTPTGGFPGIAGGALPNGVVVLCQAISSLTTQKFYCSSWTNSTFNLRGIGYSGSGTVQVCFTAYSVS